MGEYPKVKQVKKEPKFKSTDGKVTKIDDFFNEKAHVSVENFCTNCKTLVRPGAKVCPLCLHLQKDLKL